MRAFELLGGFPVGDVGEEGAKAGEERTVRRRQRQLEGVVIRCFDLDAGPVRLEAEGWRGAIEEFTGGLALDVPLEVLSGELAPVGNRRVLPLHILADGESEGLGIGGFPLLGEVAFEVAGIGV
ncbi:hypothetical protein [Candidatus Amarobacter glycogenicus]|uniref:hypothetical protein n=1 Tax=Candidatus Amarobacter glycogenicus TaxID=3140699 RepID=UPI0031CCAE20